MGSSTTNTTQAQNQAQNSLSNMLYGSQSGTSTGQTTAASSVGASGPSALAQQYLASGAAPISGSAISNYSNPYQSQVTDTTMAQLGQMFGQQQAGVVGSAISGSALGGGRQALSQALLGNQQGLAAGSTLAGLNANNFNTSLQAAQSDANRQITAAGLSGTQTAQQQQGQTAGQSLAQNLGQIVQGSTMQGAGTGSGSTTSNPSMLSMLGTGVGAMGAMGKGSGGAVRGMADGGSIHRADGGNTTTDIALTGGMDDSGMKELMQMLALSRSMQQPMVPMKLNQSNAGQGQQQSSQGKGLSSLFKGLGGNNNSSSDNSSSGDTSGDTSGLGMDSGSGKGSSGADGADVGGFASGGGTPAISMPSLKDTVPLSQSYQALQLPSLSLPSLNMPSLSMPNVSMPTLPAMQTPGTGSFQVPMPTVPPAQAASSGGKGSGGAVHEDVHHLMNEFNRVNGGALKGMDLGGNVSGNQGGIPNQISFLGIPIPLKKPGFADGGYDDTGDDWALPTQPDQQPISSSPPPSSTDLGNDIPLPTPNPFREKPSTIGINDEIEGPPSLSRSIPPITPASSSQSSEWFPQREGSPPPYSASDIGNVIGEAGSYVGNKLGQIPSSIDRLLGINYGNESDYKSPIQQYQEEQKQKEVPGAIQPQAPQPQSGSLPDLATSVRSERYSPTGERLDTQQPSLAGLATPTSSTIPTSSLPPEQAQEYATAAKNAEDASKANVPTTQISNGNYNSNLAADRQKFADELANNPQLRQKIMAIAAGEQGNHPIGTRAIVESMMNRASLYGTSLEKQARLHASTGINENGYYAGYKPQALNNPKTAQLLSNNIDEALKGTNDSNFATDNASGSWGQGRIDSGMFNKQSGIHGELFMSPGDSRAAGYAKYPAWRQAMEQGSVTPGQQQELNNSKIENQENIGNNETLTEKGKQGGIPPLVPQQLLAQGYTQAKQAIETARASREEQAGPARPPQTQDEAQVRQQTQSMFGHGGPFGVLGNILSGGQGFNANKSSPEMGKRLMALGMILASAGQGPSGIAAAANLLYGGDKGNDKEDKANQQRAVQQVADIQEMKHPTGKSTESDAFGNPSPATKWTPQEIAQREASYRATNPWYDKVAAASGMPTSGGNVTPPGSIQTTPQRAAPQSSVTPTPYTASQGPIPNSTPQSPAESPGATLPDNAQTDVSGSEIPKFPQATYDSHPEFRKPNETSVDYLTRLSKVPEAAQAVSYAEKMLTGQIKYPSMSRNPGVSSPATNPALLAGERIALEAGGSAQDYDNINMNNAAGRNIQQRAIALKTVAHHIPIAMEKLSNLPDSKLGLLSKVVNEAGIWKQTQSNDPEINALLTDVNKISSESARVDVGNSNALHDRMEKEDLFKLSQGKQSLHRTFAEVSRLAQGSADAIDNERQSIVSSPFIKNSPIIDPKTKNKLDSIDQQYNTLYGPKVAGPNMPSFTNPSDAMKLPSGTHFLDANGHERIRP